MPAYISKQESETKPLKQYPNNGYFDKLDLHYYEFKEPKKFNLYDAHDGKYLEYLEPPEIIFGIKAKPEQFCKYDFLSSPDGPAFVVHGRVIEKFKEYCPEDYQAFNMEIHNLDPKDEEFINKDFYLINIIHRIDAIDKEKSVIVDWGDGIYKVRKKVYKEDGMCGHMLARCALEGGILFDQSLAKKFKQSKGVQFLSDVESSA